MTINQDQILHAARLAKIQIDKDHMNSFLARIATVFNWIEQLQAVNTLDIAPLVNPMEDMTAQNHELRQDTVTDGNCAFSILANAPSQEFDMFKVPKVVE